MVQLDAILNRASNRAGNQTIFFRQLSYFFQPCGLTVVTKHYFSLYFNTGETKAILSFLDFPLGF